MAVGTRLITIEELEKMPQTDARVELVEGEIIKMPPAGHEHGEIAGNIFAAMHAFIRKNKLGKVYAAETGFILHRNPDTVRAPDAAFVTAERAKETEGNEGFFPGPPDLAVEVISPNDSDEDVEAKVLDYLRAGTRRYSRTRLERGSHEDCAKTLSWIHGVPTDAPKQETGRNGRRPLLSHVAPPMLVCAIRL